MSRSTERGSRRRSINVREILPNVGSALFLVWAALALTGMRDGRQRNGIPRLALAMAVVLAAWGGTLLLPDRYPVGWLLLSITPVFSFTGVLLLAALIDLRFFGGTIFRLRDATGLAAMAVAICVPLYASSLGLVSYDVYALGYRAGRVLPVFLVAAAILFGRKIHAPALAILLAAATYASELLPSDNYFDHLTDGLTFILAAGFLILSAFRKKPSV
jgi:hypothetical protein